MTPRLDNITVIANRKGGVGKTTTAANLGAFLAAEHRCRVLLVDLDPQGCLSACLGVGPPEASAAGCQASSLFGLPAERNRALANALPTAIPNLRLIPASPKLSDLEVELAARIGRETILREALAPALRGYDRILIDTAPTAGLLTVNALAAARDVLVPVETQYLSVRGLRQFLDLLQEVRERLNPRLRLLGVLPTKFSRRLRSHREVLEFLTRERAFHVFPPIPRDVRAEEAPSHRKPLFLYDSRSRSAEAYRELAREVISRAA